MLKYSTTLTQKAVRCLVSSKTSLDIRQKRKIIATEALKKMTANPFIKTYIALLPLLFCACNGSGSFGDAITIDSMAPREATDPVPAPPTLPDSAEVDPSASLQQQEVLYQLQGTEPFWSLKIGRPYSIFRSAEGDSMAFAFQEPAHAAARPPEWLRLYPLGKESWVLLRKGNSPCSDGMSGRKYAYTASLWLNDRLLDGCGEKL